MSKFMAVVFHDEPVALHMRAALARLQSQYLLEMEEEEQTNQHAPNAPVVAPAAVRLTAWRNLILREARTRAKAAPEWD